MEILLENCADRGSVTCGQKTRSTATLFFFLTGQISLPCNILLCTELQYSLPLIINIGKQWNQMPEFIPPNSNSASTAASASPSTLNMLPALIPISTLVQSVLVIGYKQPPQINDFITVNMQPFIPLHFLCTHFWQLVKCNELLPTPLPQTPHCHLAAF